MNISDYLSAFHIAHILPREVNQYDFLNNAEDQNISSVHNNTFKNCAILQKHSLKLNTFMAILRHLRLFSALDRGRAEKTQSIILCIKIWYYK
jgi:hypothetical protein